MSPPADDPRGGHPVVQLRSAELIERLLTDGELRRRFRADAAAVLVEAGLPELAEGLGDGQRALMTLELRESRSSLAGVMVAAAAEAVDVVQLAEHAVPALAHGVGSDVHRLLEHHPKPRPRAKAKPAPKPIAKPSLGAPAQVPKMATNPAPKPGNAVAQPSSQTSSDGAASSSSSAPASATPPPTSSAGSSTGAPDYGAKLVTSHHGGGHSRAEPRGRQPHDRTAAGHSAAPVQAASEPQGPAYPGDDATPQQLAAWMGAQAEQAGLPPELPVMAALTESGLHNLSYGDRDSVGFFQMRLGIWDEGPYTGYPTHPELQVQWFIDHALAVKQENPALAQSPNSWGEWVADVEQPAAQYRYRYQLQLGTAQSLLHGADQASPSAPAASATDPSAGSGSAVSVAPTPAPAAPPPPPPGQGALDVALGYLHKGGAGGASLHAGPNSAELVQFAYARQGIQMPAVAAEQFDLGTPVSPYAMHAGDAVFFASSGGYVDHVGLYVGNGRFVTETAGGVKILSLDDPSFGHLVGARRYTTAGLSDPSNYARPMPTVSPSAAPAQGGSSAPGGSAAQSASPASGGSAAQNASPASGGSAAQNASPASGGSAAQNASPASGGSAAPAASPAQSGPAASGASPAPSGSPAPGASAP